MIRKLKPCDIENVMKIWLAGNIEVHSFVPRAYWEINAPTVREQLLQADVYVYDEDDVIQGFVGMQENYLAGIFVDKAYRSGGIGKILLNFIKERFPSFSLTVYQKNQRAIAFYQREGLVIASKELEEDTGNMEYTMKWLDVSVRKGLEIKGEI